MIITVGGSIGSGKSTLARMLADKLGYKYLSIGSIMRGFAQERGITLIEMSKLAEKDPTIDRELDRRQKELAKGNSVVDSRLGAHMLIADFSIWVKASPEVCAKRVAGRDDITIKEAKKAIAERRASEEKRYQEIYGIDLEDKSVYDLVLDTDGLTPAGMLEESLKSLKLNGF
jgi:cytidylate kinase